MKKIPINSTFYNALLALQQGVNQNIVFYNILKTYQMGSEIRQNAKTLDLALTETKKWTVQVWYIHKKQYNLRICSCMLVNKHFIHANNRILFMAIRVTFRYMYLRHNRAHKKRVALEQCNVIIYHTVCTFKSQWIHWKYAQAAKSVIMAPN